MGGFTEAVCIASGPSLSNTDCDAVRGWRDAFPGRFVVVTNNTYLLCPWADLLFAMDNEWWRQHGEDARQKFGGLLFSRYGNYGTRITPASHGKNSGAGAIYLAAAMGARRIILLGYDCQHTGGKSHWHGNHKFPLGNTESLPHWAGYFQAVADALPGVVINASRETALSCFPRGRLEDELYSTR